MGRQDFLAVALAAVVMSSGMAGPAAGEALSLEQAIAMALQNNRELSAADARLEAAEAGVDEANAARLPQVDLAAGFQRTDHPVQVFGTLLSQGEFGAENFAIDALNQPAPLSDWNSRLSLSLPLWTGGGIRAQREAAVAQREAATAGREQARQQVIYRVMESYSAAVLAQGQLEVAKGALAAAQANVKVTEDLWQAGLVVESDPLQAKVRESAVQELVIRAESGVAVSRAALNQVLGRDLDELLELPSDLAVGEAAAFDLAALLEEGRESRPDLEAAAQQVETARLQLKAERSTRWPQLVLQSAVDTDGQDFFTGDNAHWSAGVGFRLRLFDGAAGRSRERQAEARQREAEAQRQLLEDAVGLQIRQAYYELDAARQRLEQASAAVALAERGRAIVEDRYKSGLARLPELLDAETALTEARLRAVAARRDLLLTRAALDLAAGRL